MAGFANRADAGRRLAAELRQRSDLALDLVLAVPRGGLLVADPIAEALGLPLDVCVARKVGVPFQQELAMGAVTRFGAVWNADVLARVKRSEAQLQAAAERAQREVERREQEIRGDAAPIDAAGKRVVLVDDGLATGATMAAAVRAVQHAVAAHVVVAIPVASGSAVGRIEALGADVMALATPSDFLGVGQFFADFGQVAEAACVAVLRRARARDQHRLRDERRGSA